MHISAPNSTPIILQSHGFPHSRSCVVIVSPAIEAGTISRVDVVFSRRHLFVVEDDDGRAVSGVVDGQAAARGSHQVVDFSSLSVGFARGSGQVDRQGLAAADDDAGVAGERLIGVDFMGVSSFLLHTPGDYGRITAELSGVIFKDPAADPTDPEAGWQMADEYLSGDVRAKLRMAQFAAETNPEFAVNVDALASQDACRED